MLDFHNVDKRLSLLEHDFKYISKQLDSISGQIYKITEAFNLHRGRVSMRSKIAKTVYVIITLAISLTANDLIYYYIKKFI